MMYPKPQRKKKRKKHKASILHCKDGTCYLCMKLKGDYRRYPVVHEHHIYDGPNRQNSEAEGLKVGTVEESTQRGSADGSWRVPEMQGKEDIHESYDSASCELCQETSGHGSGDMV